MPLLFDCTVRGLGNQEQGAGLIQDCTAFHDVNIFLEAFLTIVPLSWGCWVWNPNPHSTKGDLFYTSLENMV